MLNVLPVLVPRLNNKERATAASIDDSNNQYILRRMPSEYAASYVASLNSKYTAQRYCADLVGSVVCSTRPETYCTTVVQQLCACSVALMCGPFCHVRVRMGSFPRVDSLKQAVVCPAAKTNL